jgi:hypothetical protein
MRALVMSSILFASACAGDDAPAGDTGGSGESSGGEEAPSQCSDTSEQNAFYEPPGECYNNTNCASCNCVTFQDNPPYAASMCGAATTGTTRVTATVWTFPEQTAVPDQMVRIVGATDIGLNGPENAETIGEATSNADGQIDLTVTPTDQIGIVAIVSAMGFRDTATGLAKPETAGYEAANAIHDIFVVPEATLAAYSSALMSDSETSEHLPLGDNGGVVGIARNRYTGEPEPGVRIVSLAGTSAAVVRYLGEDGTFGTDATTATGVYVIVDPALAEEFEAQKDGVVVSTRANKAGSGPPGIFTMNLTIDTDPGSDPFE